jgi:hypothetical protein
VETNDQMQFTFTDGQERITHIIVQKEDENICIREELETEIMEVNVPIQNFLLVALSILQREFTLKTA